MGKSWKTSKETKMTILVIYTQHSTEILAKINSTRGRNKNDSRWKEVKMSLFGDDMILFRENPEDFTKVRSLDLINK